MDKNLIALIKEITERLNAQIDIPEDEKYFKKYEGAGIRTAYAWDVPELNNEMKNLIYDMDPSQKKWDEYKDKYFESKKLRLKFKSDEFIDKFNKCWFVVKHLYEINRNRSYKHSPKYGNIDMDELCRINKNDMYQWWGRMMTNYNDKLIEGKEYTFCFDLPISDHIPDFNDF